MEMGSRCNNVADGERTYSGYSFEIFRSNHSKQQMEKWLEKSHLEKEQLLLPKLYLSLMYDFVASACLQYKILDFTKNRINRALSGRSDWMFCVSCERLILTIPFTNQTRHFYGMPIISWTDRFLQGTLPHTANSHG